MQIYRKKIRDLQETKKGCLRLRDSDKRIVFTNGCFDILHPGHARYLYAARELGDYLIVAVNSDKSVKAIKGPGRPIISEGARMEMLAALGCVDSVLIFDENTPLAVISQLRPHVLVKGGDWSKDKIIGADLVKKAGGRVINIPFEQGFSTTEIIEKIWALHS
jgi:D-beta-D-heptose 7-phosphate kinase/D-beta-D-heptose 1-phosphate adenosyltransferase